MIRSIKSSFLAIPTRQLSTFVKIAPSSSKMGPVEELIIEKITALLSPTLLTVFNDSHKHSHHKAMQLASNVQESHFRLVIVCDKFAGMTMPARHRLVYRLLDDEFKNKGLHALQMSTKTESEAQKAPVS